MVSRGKVGFKEVEEAVTSLTSEGGKFFNLTKKQSETFNGLFSTMKDNIGLLARAFGDELLPIVKPLLKSLITFLQKAREQFPRFVVDVRKFFIDIKKLF